MKPFLLNILEKILKSLANATLRRYKPGIIGITGNVGKTSTKEAMKAILSSDRRVRASSKNFNNELGLPLSILGDWKDTGGLFFWIKVIIVSVTQLIFKKRSYPEMLILEYGVDAPGDMKKLIEIAKPHIGVVTAIGKTPPVHIEFFASREAVIREKTRLINQLPATGFAVLNADDKAIMGMKHQTRAHTVTFGFAESADVKVSNFETHLDSDSSGVVFKLNHGGGFVPMKIDGALGKAQAYSTAAAAAVGLFFGINLVKASEALASFDSPKGRLKIIRGMKDSAIIDDTYNSAPLSTKEALETLKSLRARRKIAVLGDMLELGKHSIDAHEIIGKMASEIATIIITVGSKAKFIAEAATQAGHSGKNIFRFDKVGEAGLFLQGMIKEKDLILVKGSQSVRMEKIVKEVMNEPDRAEELLVRQTKRWLQKPGIYD